MSIFYGRTVLWNLNEENEAEKDIFLVDGAPWYLLAFGQKRHECIALTCNHSNSVVNYIYIVIVIVIIVVITRITIIILIIVIITNNQNHQECIALDALMQLLFLFVAYLLLRDMAIHSAMHHITC